MNDNNIYFIGGESDDDLFLGSEGNDDITTIKDVDNITENAFNILQDKKNYYAFFGLENFQEIDDNIRNNLFKEIEDISKKAKEELLIKDKDKLARIESYLNQVKAAFRNENSKRNFDKELKNILNKLIEGQIEFALDDKILEIDEHFRLIQQAVRFNLINENNKEEIKRFNDWICQKVIEKNCKRLGLKETFEERVLDKPENFFINIEIRKKEIINIYNSLKKKENYINSLEMIEYEDYLIEDEILEILGKIGRPLKNKIKVFDEYEIDQWIKENGILEKCDSYAYFILQKKAEKDYEIKDEVVRDLLKKKGITIAEENKSENFIICPKCGNKNREKMKFCGFCGISLTEDNSSKETKKIFSNEIYESLINQNKIDEALTYLKEASISGNSEAQGILSRVLISEENGVKADYEEAHKWADISAKNDDKNGCYTLGKIYYEGLGKPKDNVKSLKWYKLSAEQGDAQAQCHLGIMYEYGQGVKLKQNYTEALKWYKLSAEQGNATAQYKLGVMYYHGKGVEQDYTEALKWFKLSAEQGNAEAQCNLGYMYDVGKGVNQDYTEAVKWYKLSAEQGYANSQFNLGYMYDVGKGVKQDYTEAVKWYKLSAEQGNATAQYKLGYMYDVGKGVNQDYTEALKWYKLSADQGNASAQFYLGYMYDVGKGVKQDYAEALKWYKLSAKKGNADAQYQLGYMYDMGRGVKQDYAEALKWYKLSAKKGECDSSIQFWSYVL